MAALIDRGRAALALTVLLTTVLITGATTPDRPVPVAVAATPALPPAVLVQAGGVDELVVVNPTPVPLTVLDPAGNPFLRISGAGVETDAAAPFTYRSRYGADTATVLPPGVVDGAPPRWTRVSDDVSWRWHDPRLRPATGSAPVGGRSDVRQVLARWTVPLRYGQGVTTLERTLELHPQPGRFDVVADPLPAGLDAVFPGGNRIVLAATGPITVLGVDGEEFLRRSDAGWEVATGSRTHQLDLLAVGRPVPAPRGWQPYSGPGPVTWSDARLTPPVELDAAARAGGEAVRWSIPVLLEAGPTALSGAVLHIPDVVGAGSGGSIPTPVLATGVALLAGLLAALAALHRRRSAPPADVRPMTERTPVP